MSDFCYGCGQYVGQGCTCDSKHEQELINTIKTLEDTIKFKDEQVDRELADNNGLRASIGILSVALRDIETLTFGEEGEWVDIIKDILKKKSEAILKK